jgi:outer membrane lipoprotein-sorting protein
MELLSRFSILLVLGLAASTTSRAQELERWHDPSIAQAEPTTADQVIARYMEAVGADRFSSITTFQERGDLYGNLTNFWQGSRAPWQSQNKERGTFEFYFKTPNLRFSSTLNEKNQVVALHGCDGKVSWYIDTYLKRSEFKPKPGSEYDCENGFEPMPSPWRKANVKMRLTKKKEVEGRMTWEVKVSDPKSQGTEMYYFDAETYFLLRLGRLESTATYSDYRDVGGIKLPFKTVREFTNSRLVTTVRELRINSPVDDARFSALQLKGGDVAINPVASPKKDDAEVPSIASPNASAAPNAESSGNNSSKTSATPSAQSVTEVNFPNFTSCPIAELQLTVPELKGLKPARDQEKLPALLDKVGDKTLDIARHTPNLISRETVTESQQGVAGTRHDYDYLILSRVEGNVVGLNEFRMDRNTGDKFQTDEAMKSGSSFADLERASPDLAASRSGRPPTSQGFANSWVHFYPPNRPQATFRYLGEQKMDGQRTLVLAFAQKPQAVLSPALLRSNDKTVPMFLQGVAWVSTSDFRILRLRTDLLSPVPEVSLHRLTTDTQFVPTRIEEVPSVLWLPRDVMVTSEVGGATLREDHTYSEYRLFRAQSRVVLNP